MKFFTNSVFRAFEVFAALFFVFLVIANLAMAEPGSGSYELPRLDPNNSQPVCSGGKVTSAVFSSIDLNVDDENDTLSVDLALSLPPGESLPTAQRYLLQYIDNDYFADEDGLLNAQGYLALSNSAWITIKEYTAIDDIIGDHVTDNGYKLGSHRYYRLAAVSGSYIIHTANYQYYLYDGDDTENGSVDEYRYLIAGILHDQQEWDVVAETSLVVGGYSKDDAPNLGEHVMTPKPSVRRVNYLDPDAVEAYDSLGAENFRRYYQEQGICRETWEPVYPSGVDNPIILYSRMENYDPNIDAFTHITSKYHDEVDSNATELIATGITLKEDFALNEDFSYVTYSSEDDDLEGLFDSTYSIHAYPYSVSFSDFRGDLSLFEAPIFDLSDDETFVVFSPSVYALKHDYDPSGFGVPRVETGSVKIEWEGAVVAVFERDGNEESGWADVALSGPLTVGEGDYEEGDVLGIFGEYKIIPLRAEESTDITITVTFPEPASSFTKIYTIHFKDSVKEKVTTHPDYYNVPFNTATGPRYRKVGLNGRPLADEKPQAVSENDEAKEETYIDAFNLNLVHSVTDIYIPIQGSELALSVRRNLTPEIWSENSGLRPSEHPGKPFGAGWSSNICSYIKVVTPTGPDVDQFEEPVKAYVSDENGQMHEFVQYKDEWFPLPSATHEARSYLTSLTQDSSGFTFKQKHGNTLEFTDILGSQLVRRDRVEGSDNYETYGYARLISVTDRLGYQIQYQYTGVESLIPNRIFALNASGEDIQDLEINLIQEGGRVTYAYDPKHNEIEYRYIGYMDDDGYGLLALEIVKFANGGETTYGYEVVQEGAYIPLNASDAEFGPYSDPASTDACDGQQQHVHYNHLNLKMIEDANENRYTFDYDFDHSKEIYVFNSYADDYFIQTGNPRNVTVVTLPNTSGTARFINGNLDSRIRIETTGEEYEGVAITNQRSNSVIDAEGFETSYTFQGMAIEVMKQFKEVWFEAAMDAGELPAGTLMADTSYKDPRILYYTEMEISHGEDVEGAEDFYGTETYIFNISASLALGSATDLSGNVKEYKYTNTFPVSGLLADIWPNLYGVYNDPTEEIHTGKDGLVATKTFVYGPFRIMTTYVDPENRKTVTGVDLKGRRLHEKIYSDAADDDDNYVQYTEFQYEEDEWPGVVTTQTVHGIENVIPSIVTHHDLDNNGRIETTTQYPRIDADSGDTDIVPDLKTAYTYDDNNNRKTVEQGSEGAAPKVTTFAYDTRNRLKSTTFHDQTQTRNYYDLRGNLCVQVDENDHATVNQYDQLNRLHKTIRIINSSYPGESRPNFEYEPDGDDLVTTNLYNEVNSLRVTSSTDGPTTTMTYDDLQRVTTSTVSGAGMVPQITQFTEYGTNSGGSVFNTSGFKPTEIIDPRGYTTKVTYDSLYRATETQVEFKSEQYATTVNDYDLVGNLLTVTDPLLKVTKTAYDALNRPIAQTLAYGSDDAFTTLTNYTKTGLAYQSIQLIDGNYSHATNAYIAGDADLLTETVYDKAGRPIKVIQPLVDVYGGGAATPITKTFYDDYGNAWKTVNPLLEEWTTTFDERNRPRIVTQPDTNYIDEFGAPQTGSGYTETTYDNVGNVRSMRDARGNISYTTYDAANRPVLSMLPQVTLADGSTVHPATQSEYDRSGNILYFKQGTVDDPAAISPEFTSARIVADNTYDAAGRLLNTTDAEAITVTNEYDKSGNLTAVIDGKEQRTEFEYDGLSRNTITRHHDGSFKELAYNAVNQTTRTDELKQVTTYTYDDRHRLENVIYNGAPDQNRTYRYFSVGNIRDVVEPGKGGLTDVAYTYDALQRIETETSGGITHRYAYDLAGNRRSTIYDDGGSNTRTIIATYDALNRTEEIIEDNVRTSRYRYDLAGNIREKGQANTDVIIKEYDALGRTTSIRGPTDSQGDSLYISTNAYDLYGNLAQIEETYPSADAKLDDRTVVNAYDGVNRLNIETITTVDSDSGVNTVVITDYDYDDAHNRTAKLVTQQIDSAPVETLEDAAYSFDNFLNQIDSYTDSISGRSVDYDYDANGNRTLADDGTTPKNYRYDRENRLIEFEEGGAIQRTIDVYLGTEAAGPSIPVTYLEQTGISGDTYTYAYDYRTRRVLRDESGASGSSTKVIFSGGTSVQEYDNSASSPSVEYVRGSDYGGGIGGILYTLRSGTPSFKHYNSRGDVVAATDASGSLTYQAAYEAFGQHGTTSSSAEWGSTDDRQQANTKDEDPTGLLNEGFRYRDLETGTFITRDPLGFVDGPNVYTYVVQNPWTKFDPLGLSEEDIGFITKVGNTKIAQQVSRSWKRVRQASRIAQAFIGMIPGQLQGPLQSVPDIPKSPTQTARIRDKANDLAEKSEGEIRKTAGGGDGKPKKPEAKNNNRTKTKGAFGKSKFLKSKLANKAASLGKTASQKAGPLGYVATAGFFVVDAQAVGFMGAIENVYVENLELVSAPLVAKLEGINNVADVALNAAESGIKSFTEKVTMRAEDSSDQSNNDDK